MKAARGRGESGLIRAITGAMDLIGWTFVEPTIELPPTIDLDCFADWNCDRMVGSADLSELLGSWGDAGSPMDLNGDGTVNAGDLAVLLGSWGMCEK